MKKIKIGILLVILLGIVGYVSNFLFRYYLYDDYKQYLSSYEVEDGNEFKPINEIKSDVLGMVLVAENDAFKLYTNLTTTETAIFDKRTKEITYSNPQNREEDSIANGTNKAELNAQLVVRYYNTARNSAVINNYEMSVQHEQFTVEAIENGIRYIYELKEPSTTTGIVPTKITKERLETLVLNNLSSKDAKATKSKFILKEDTYELLEDVQKSKVGMSKLNKLFEKSGYTEEAYAEDMKDQDIEEKISFTIPLEYRLIEDGLNVSVPAKEIKETGGAKIFHLEVLKFFGAAGTNEAGYMLVPNGSGSLIEFNNGKKDAAYSQYVYGIDPTVQAYVVIENTQKARLPIFGIKKEESAVFARIQSGDALASINADVSGKLNSYNYTYARFDLREMELLDMFGISNTQSDTPIIEKNHYNTHLSIDYAFLPKEEASYSGMANYYRDCLIKEGVLEKKEASENLPLYLDILGAVESTEHFVGIPYQAIIPMTTFEEAGEIVELLAEENIHNIRMNYKGWFNGGIYHDVADKVKVIKELGGKKDIEKLSRQLEEKGGKLFGDTAFQKVSFSSSRYDYRLESSKYYSGYIVSFGKVNPATMRQVSTLNWYEELLYNVISPKFLVRYVDKFSKAIEDIDITGIGLRDLGDYLASDKKRNHIINRQEAKEVVQGQFEKLDATSKDLLVNGGDYYALKYASDIINIPTTQSDFYIVDQEVPFYEMLIHGAIDYSGSEINRYAQGQDDILKMIEYGIAPRFVFSYKEPSPIKYTSSAEYYSAYYKTWIEEAISTYNEVNVALKKVVNSYIMNHEIMENRLHKVIYDNGVTILINYTDEILDAEQGISVQPHSYLVKGGE